MSSSSIHTISSSDHALISVVVQEENTKNPTFIWPANSQIIHTPAHAAFIPQQLTEFFAINTPSVSSPSTLWCAHKAFIKGLLLQLSSHVKKQRTQKLEILLSKIKQSLNKANPDTETMHKLFKLRLELRLLLLEQFDKHLASLKLSHYSSGNRAGKFLAQRLQRRKAQKT